MFEYIFAISSVLPYFSDSSIVSCTGTGRPVERAVSSTRLGFVAEELFSLTLVNVAVVQMGTAKPKLEQGWTTGGRG